MPVSDFPYHAAAALAITLMDEYPALSEAEAIHFAWRIYEADDPKSFHLILYDDEVRIAIRRIRLGYSRLDPPSWILQKARELLSTKTQGASSWQFVLHDDVSSITWTWRRMRADGTIERSSEPHRGFGQAVADAIAHAGFQPKRDPWVTIAKGRYTHFRPGEKPVAIPDDRNPAAAGLNIRPSEPEPGLPTSGESVKTEDKSEKS